MVPSLPITDNHLHVDSINGLGPVEVGRLFSRSGGTHALVVNKVLGFATLDEFKRTQNSFLSEVERMNSGTEVIAFPVVGPHPAQLAKLWAVLGPDGTKELMEQALQHSVELIRDRRATALGEVGRPHFEVPEEIIEASNSLLDRSMELAADLGCAVQVHMETSTPEQYAELGERARRSGLPPWRVVKHFSPPLVDVGVQTGIMPSVISSRENVRHALAQGDRFLVETDYMDDSSRPGAVLGPRTVPRVTRSLMEEGVLDERSAHRIHVENVEKTYGIEVSL
jgi:TatD-related deoxyribonuclease